MREVKKKEVKGKREVRRGMKKMRKAEGNRRDRTRRETSGFWKGVGNI
jgi:hypothetical protein